MRPVCFMLDNAHEGPKMSRKLCEPEHQDFFLPKVSWPCWKGSNNKLSDCRVLCQRENGGMQAPRGCRVALLWDLFRAGDDALLLLLGPGAAALTLLLAGWLFLAVDLPSLASEGLLGGHLLEGASRLTSRFGGREGSDWPAEPGWLRESCPWARPGWDAAVRGALPWIWQALQLFGLFLAGWLPTPVPSRCCCCCCQSACHTRLGTPLDSRATATTSPPALDDDHLTIIKATWVQYVQYISYPR